MADEESKELEVTESLGEGIEDRDDTEVAEGKGSPSGSDDGKAGGTDSVREPDTQEIAGPNESLDAGDAPEGEASGIIESLVDLSKHNDVLVVVTDDESSHIATCVILMGFLERSPEHAHRKLDELRNLFDKAEEEPHATISIVRYDPRDDSSEVTYSTRTHMRDGWRAPLRIKAHRHLVDAMVATDMWWALPPVRYKKSLI